MDKLEKKAVEIKTDSGTVSRDTSPVNENKTKDASCKRDSRTYTSKFPLGYGPGLIVGLPWPVLGPIPLDLFNSNNVETPECGDKSALEETSVTAPNSSGIYFEGDNKNDESLIVEVSFPRPLKIGAHLSQPDIEKIIQDYCNQEYKSAEGTGGDGEGECFGAAAVLAELAAQIFDDNDRQLCVLITDVGSYPISNKPEIWNAEEFGTGNAEYTIAFNCLFSIGYELFYLFIFSPMSIKFTIEVGQCGIANNSSSKVFFHGKASVSVDTSWQKNNKWVIVQFCDEWEDEDDGEDAGANQRQYANGSPEVE